MEREGLNQEQLTQKQELVISSPEHAQKLLEVELPQARRSIEQVIAQIEEHQK